MIFYEEYSLKIIIFLKRIVNLSDFKGTSLSFIIWILKRSSLVIINKIKNSLIE